MENRRISRRAALQAAALGAGAVAAPVVLAQPRLTRARVGIAVSQKESLANLPLTVAEQLGYFRAEGLEVEVIEGAAGSADVTCAPYERVLLQHLRGVPHQAIVLQARAPAMALGVSVRAMPSVRGLADLRGRRIGVPSPGSSGHLVASVALARAGVPLSDVSFIDVGLMPSAPAALRGGQVDAICSGEPVMTLLEQRAEVRIVTDTRTLKGTQAVFGGPMPAGCLHASQEFVQKHPATCQALVFAIVHALKWLQTAGPRDILRTVPETHVGGDRALYLASFEKLRESISPDGVFDPTGAGTALRALAEFDPVLRSARVELARTYTNEFALRAKARFDA